MSIPVLDRVEILTFENCKVIHIKLIDLKEKETSVLVDLVKEKVIATEGNIMTLYSYEGYSVTPASKKQAKQLAEFIDTLGPRFKGTVAYGLDYFVRLVASIIRPKTTFLKTKEQAIEYIKQREF